MFIKEILKYDYNYAEYIVSDDINELICMCISVPLPFNKKPEKGMIVSKLYAFSYNSMHIYKVNPKENQAAIIKGESWFEYTLCGKISNISEALVSIAGFSISLEYYFEEGFPPNEYQENDLIMFKVDRLDAKLLNM